MWKNIERTVMYITVFLVIAFLVPIYMYACYTVPLADDFNMAGGAYWAWVDTGSIWSVIVAAWKQSMYQYMTWAGEYVCMFLQALPIGLGNFRLYFISSWVNTSILVLAVYYAGKVFLIDYLGADKRKYRITVSVIFLFMITFLPEIYDAFYWHTTVISYTLSFAVKLVILAGIFKTLFVEKKVEKRMLVLLAIGTFLAGGFEASFSQTSFFLAITAFLIVLILKKEKLGLALLYWFATTIGWGIALLAPGNMARQEKNYGGTTSVFAVIWESMHRGFDAISENINIPLLLVTLLILPMIYKVVKKSKGTFKLPGILSFYSIAMYASAYAPWIFSRGTEAPSPYGGDSGYVRNVFWMTFVILWFVNVIYWTGWFAKNFVLEVKGKNKKEIIHKKIGYYGIILMLVLFWSIKLEHVMEYTSPRLLWHIINGNAQRYYAGMEQREELLLENSDELIIVPKLQMPIPTRGAGDILSDENHWVNEGVTVFYRLKSGVRTEE